MPSNPTRRPASAAIWSWSPAPPAPRRGYRRALLRGGLGLVVATLVAVWKPVLGAIAAGLALLLLAVALASPQNLYPWVERALAAFARAVGLAVSWAALSFVHVLVFLPLGLFLRATGRLRITRYPDPGVASYWRPADRPRPGAGRYERQF